MELNEAIETLQNHGYLLVSENYYTNEKIKNINDVLEWLIAQGVVKPGECKKSDAEALWIPPAFEGDGAMTIRIYPDEDRLTITHAIAGKFATKSLSYEALDKAWDKMTNAAY